MHTSTNHTNWLICKKRSCVCLLLSENKHTLTDIVTFSNYVVVLQFLHAIIAINSSCNNRMSQIQYCPTLLWWNVNVAQAHSIKVSKTIIHRIGLRSFLVICLFQNALMNNLQKQASTITDHRVMGPAL